MANRKLTVLEIWMDNSNCSIEKYSKSEMDPSRMAIVMENVKMLKGVLVKTTKVGVEDSDSATTIVDDRTCNKKEWTMEGRDGND